jgi:ribosomal protein S18 acetylase RimI-like enzyme
MLIKIVWPEDLGLLSTFFIANNVDRITCSFTPFTLSIETARWIACEPHKDKFYLGLIENKPVGFSMLRGWDEGFSIPSFGIFIDYRKHGLGLGKEMLDLTIEAAKNLACEKVRLSVYTSNPSACKLYLSKGFKEIERSPVMHNGVPDQKIIMIKDLT